VRWDGPNNHDDDPGAKWVPQGGALLPHATSRVISSANTTRSESVFLSFKYIKYSTL